MGSDEDDRLLTPGEVAEMFRVTTKTVQRWAESGVLTAVRAHATGQRRFRLSQVRELLEPKDN